jgi:ribosomal RNA-processing protein 12
MPILTPPFSDDITDATLSELLKTTTHFLMYKNREIIKSALGFTKVALVTLPPSTLSPHLPDLVPALLGWVHDHKNHFKQKTIHIFERIMRRFGYDVVLGCVPEEMKGEGKVLEGIKKRKEKAKRKKGRKDDDEEEGDEPVSLRSPCLWTLELEILMNGM